MGVGRTKEELRTASEHLAYEIDMFRATADLLAAGSLQNTAVENAVLESFTVHARALVQFFFRPHKTYDDDMLAEQYVENWASVWESVPAALVKVNERVGKEIAHLTFERLRIAPAAKSWDIAEISRAMSVLIDDFQRRAPAECLVSIGVVGDEGSRWSVVTAKGMTAGVPRDAVASTNSVTAVSSSVVVESFDGSRD